MYEGDFMKKPEIDKMPKKPYDPRNFDLEYKIGAFSVKHKKKIIIISFICALVMFIISLVCSTEATGPILISYPLALISFIRGCKSHREDFYPPNPNPFFRLGGDFSLCIFCVVLIIFSFVICLLI